MVAFALRPRVRQEVSALFGVRSQSRRPNDEGVGEAVQRAALQRLLALPGAPAASGTKLGAGSSARSPTHAACRQHTPRGARLILEGDRRPPGLDLTRRRPVGLKPPPRRHPVPSATSSIDNVETLTNPARVDLYDLLEAMQQLEANCWPTHRRHRKPPQKVWLRFYVHFIKNAQPGPARQQARRPQRQAPSRGRRSLFQSNLYRSSDTGSIPCQDLGFTQLTSFIDDTAPRQVAAWQAAPYAESVREKTFCPRRTVFDYAHEEPHVHGAKTEASLRLRVSEVEFVEGQLVKADVRLVGPAGQGLHRWSRRRPRQPVPRVVGRLVPGDRRKATQ